jgi:hypothetical protein
MRICFQSLLRHLQGDIRSTERKSEKIPVTSGQIAYEFEHLKNKLHKRDRKKYIEILNIAKPLPHPLFRVRKGDVETWEKRI